MNIRYMRNVLSGIDEIKVIGKSGEADGVVCHVMGLVRRGKEMLLMALQYDERFRQNMEEDEASEWSGAPGRPETNRTLLRSDRTNGPVLPLQTVHKVFIGEKEFEVHSSECRRLDKQDWEHLLLMVRFLNQGWRSDDMDDRRIDLLFLAGLKLEGDYPVIPDFDPNPEMRVLMWPRQVTYQVEKPVTLTVGDHYPDPIVFRDAVAGEEHWIRIHRVYLLDVWEEMENIFADPVLWEQRTPEEIARARWECEQYLPEICPRGMYFPVVEYECEDDMAVQFYSRSFLDAKPAHGSRAMGFIVRPEQPADMPGLKLKAAVIQEPVPADTVTIEAEIFQYTRCLGNGSLSELHFK
mgnify:FL=1